MEHLSGSSCVDCLIDIRLAKTRGKEHKRRSEPLATASDQMIQGLAYGVVLIRGGLVEQVLHLAQVMFSQVYER
jgi:Na+-transporting NADH:ubiquinone oxidoreductase subunit NqrD